jgi:hypothetical protein
VPNTTASMKIRATAELNLEELKAMASEGRRRFYYMRAGWPEESEEPNVNAWHAFRGA